MLTKLEAAAIYAGVNILILVVLAFRVSMARGVNKVAIGDGGVAAMQRAVRAHGNAAEYIPAGLAGLLFLALLDAAPYWLLHASGVALTLGRLMHGVGISMSLDAGLGRVGGTLITWIAFLGMAGGLIVAGLAPLL